MKMWLKACVERLLPERIFARLQSIRSRNHQMRFLKKEGLLTISRQLYERYGGTVRHGPFAGLKFAAAAVLSRHSAPRILGTYELELQPVLAEVLARAGEYESMVDIGCADGYYAVGLALKAQRPIHAFDAEPRELELCREMARLNGVERLVKTGNWCQADFLSQLRGKRSFVLCDCEGYEISLFDARAVDGLNRSDVLIELHDSPGVDTGAEMARRFGSSHEIYFIVQVPRVPGSYEELTFLGGDAPKAVCEYRNASQRWIWLRARDGVRQPGQTPAAAQD